MRSANTIMNKILITAIALLAFAPLLCYSQINSPYSRYGVGNLVPLPSISNRAMGGISAGMSDPTAVNTLNPASYSNLIYTTLDLGFEYDADNLKSKEPVANFKSKYAILSYLNVGIPLLSGNQKAQKKDIGWAMTLGLRPVTRINYKLLNEERIPVDSVSYLYEGTGGVNQALIGTALRLKNFSLGINTGFLFGEKKYSTRLTFLNDTVSYYKANYETHSHFGGMFLDAGLQYQFKVKNGMFRMGAYTQLQKGYKANRDIKRETFVYDQYGGATTVDSVYDLHEDGGKVTMPATYGVGFALEKEHFLIGADYETTSWSNYRFFGEKEPLSDSWNARVGFQYFPATVNSTGYFSFVKYRAGFSFGKDYIAVDNDLPVYSFSAGGAFPMTRKRSFYNHQYSVMNITFEYNNRGNSKNNITESMYRISLGFSLSDIWFIRRKYE